MAGRPPPKPSGHKDLCDRRANFFESKSRLRQKRNLEVEIDNKGTEIHFETVAQVTNTKNFAPAARTFMLTNTNLQMLKYRNVGLHINVFYFQSV